jgi:hypothetical protein
MMAIFQNAASQPSRSATFNNRGVPVELRIAVQKSIKRPIRCTFFGAHSSFSESDMAAAKIQQQAHRAHVEAAIVGPNQGFFTYVYHLCRYVPISSRIQQRKSRSVRSWQSRSERLRSV